MTEDGETLYFLSSFERGFDLWELKYFLSSFERGFDLWELKTRTGEISQVRKGISPGALHLDKDGKKLYILGSRSGQGRQEALHPRFPSPGHDPRRKTGKAHRLQHAHGA